MKKLFLFLSKAKETHQQAGNEAMDRYKSIKQSQLKKLVKKTRRGQSVMKRQIELLLEKIPKDKQLICLLFCLMH